MRIALVTPAPPRSTGGNRVTALRWAAILRDLGHRVRVRERYAGEPCDLLIALHARRSAASVRRFRAVEPEAPVVVALTGTDVYRDLPRSRAARDTLALATRLVVLQPLAAARLTHAARAKARVIHQSVPRIARGRLALRTFDVCVLAHLRAVKDPLLPARATRLLPESSHIRIVHAGAALSPALAARARKEAASNPRYRWLGPLPRAKALRRLASSRLFVLSSRMEGGANAISEALAAGLPILASAIDGSIGILGRRHPGLFAPGDARALAQLLRRAEEDPSFLRELTAASRSAGRLVAPARERASWKALLAELT